MPSPAQRHFLRVSAGAASAAATAGGTLAGSSAYELMLAKLHADRARLKEVQSIERKIIVKRELLPEYEGWVTGALESGRGAQDDVLVTVFVWYIDTGDYSRALDIAAYAMQHGLTLPDQYDRDIATLLADEIGDAALAAQRAGDFAAVPVDVLARTLDMTAPRDMPDPARAKLHKAFGLASREQSPMTALVHLKRALELHEGSGVKRDIAALEAALKKAGESPA